MDEIFDTLFNQYKTDLNIRSKKVWRSHTAKRLKDSHPAAPLQGPVSFVYCSFNTTSPKGQQRDFMKELGPRPKTLQVLDALKSIQMLDLRKKFHNIRYNFMIGGDGVVYKGRGWRIRPSLPARHVNNWNQGVYLGFIGYFHDEPPDDKLFQLRDELIRIGIEKGSIKKKFFMMLADQFYYYKHA
ncbi:peptidoglycan-recognition protein SA-like [Macrosteles quadrilineatus]|uniref:peptidoglycan-recognition protein SA-like n=1 Tax=Macrosteles quadrilineatus TaxID=74068 RepID=UPI0023E09729|nr:peptidoglycan-recognition protein SA-like [Macrosteles quadrilineatus]